MREKRAKKRRKLWAVWMLALFIIGGCAGGKVIYSSLFMTINAADQEESLLPQASGKPEHKEIEPIPAEAAVIKKDDAPAVVHSDVDSVKPGDNTGKAIEATPTPQATGKQTEKESAKPGSESDKPSKQIALTFDDGPDTKYTPKILDILKQHKVKATFFLVGRQIDLHPDIVKRIVDEGHVIGNHSWGHQQLNKLNAEDIKHDLDKTDQLFQKILGTAPKLFRAPYGAVSDTLKDEVKSSGREMIGWSVDTRDWAGESPEDMMKTVRRQMGPGGIVLMHSFGGKNGKLDNTVELLPKLIRELQDDGYSIVTVPELEPVRAKR